MNQGDFQDPFRASLWASGPVDDRPGVGTAVAVGVGAVGVIATAMYFLGGREAPRLPSFGELTGAAKREIGFGAYGTRDHGGDTVFSDTVFSGADHVLFSDLPANIRNEYGGQHLRCEAVKNRYDGDIIVSCKNVDNGTTWKDHWIHHNDSYRGRVYTLGAPYG